MKLEKFAACIPPQIMVKYLVLNNKHPRKLSSASGTAKIFDCHNKSFLKWTPDLSKGISEAQIALQFNINCSQVVEAPHDFVLETPVLQAISNMKSPIAGNPPLTVMLYKYEGGAERPISQALLLNNILRAWDLMAKMPSEWLLNLGRPNRTPSDYIREFNQMVDYLCSTGAINSPEDDFLMNLAKKFNRPLTPAVVHGDFTYHNMCHTPRGMILYDLETMYRGSQLDDVARLTNYLMQQRCLSGMYEIITQCYPDPYEQLPAFRAYKALFLAIHHSKKAKQYRSNKSHLQSRYWVDLALKLADSGKGFNIAEAERRLHEIESAE